METLLNPKGADDHKEDLKVVDHVLLPEAFTTINDYVSCSRISVMESNKKYDVLICALSKNMELLYHPMTVQISEARMSIKKDKKKATVRKITKLDYMEYMVRYPLSLTLSSLSFKSYIFCADHCDIDLYS